jgi:hypothetical protein
MQVIFFTTGLDTVALEFMAGIGEPVSLIRITGDE